MADALPPLLHLALVSESDRATPHSVMKVAAALQKQVLRDLSPHWGTRATVDAFQTLDDVPTDYWPMIIQKNLKDFPGAAGIHLDDNGHPFALIDDEPGWSLTASHETIEMLCDPLGNTTRAGASPKQDQGRVDFLVEPCDPSEARKYAYTINGVVVSDFYLPSYFEPVAVPGQRYSFTGAITAPRQVLPGGYLSWFEPVSAHWWQLVHFNKEPQFRDLGELTQGSESIRTQIYRRTPEAMHDRQQRPDRTALMARFTASAESMGTAGSSRAKRLRASIERVKQSGS